MARFRKKPVVIEAVQWPLPYAEWPSWLKEAWDKPLEEASSFYSMAGGAYFISTLEGAHIVSDGDFIIRGVKHELYPRKPDVFALTYEPFEFLFPGPVREAPVAADDDCDEE